LTPPQPKRTTNKKKNNFFTDMSKYIRPLLFETKNINSPPQKKQLSTSFPILRHTHVHYEVIEPFHVKIGAGGEEISNVFSFLCEIPFSICSLQKGKVAIFFRI
jgi:hypothetical protein